MRRRDTIRMSALAARLCTRSSRTPGACRYATISFFDRGSHAIPADRDNIGYLQECSRKKFASASAASQHVAVAEKDLEDWAHNDDVHLHAYSVHSRKAYQLSKMKVVGDRVAEAPDGWDMRLVSAAGRKGDMDNYNQDSFSYTQLANGWIFCIACDGHGEVGEEISERVSKTIPLLLRRSLVDMSMEQALQFAFLGAQSDLEQNFRTDQVYSGTTATVWCMNFELQELWFAHVGDSAAVLGDLADASVVFSTREHKAHDPEEGERLKKFGAQVVRKKYTDGEIMSRVFVPRAGIPGLAMSRSLGDGCLKNYGVIADPEIKNLSSLWTQCNHPIIVVGSDGLWDAITFEDGIDALSARFRSSKDWIKSAEFLCRRAQQLWGEYEDNYCDDITVLIMAPLRVSTEQ